jgi:wyosine [tRNA(Phe)-imidazoG37] synthetase (radical SAM superfamily)
LPFAFCLLPFAFSPISEVVIPVQSTEEQRFSSVYGPVQSWRFGRSLGVDPIGVTSTCSFNCVYCQLGDIQQQTVRRQVFVSTKQILRDLRTVPPQAAFDVVTISGSGEPTLALNLADILSCIKEQTLQPVAVLTNGTLLDDPKVRADLGRANSVAVKLDAVSPEQLRRVNRPVAGVDLATILSGLALFRLEYQGNLAIQTMVLSPWSPEVEAEYIRWLRCLTPDEVQLNTPSRPRPLTRTLSARGNQELQLQPQELQHLKCVDRDLLRQFADRICTATSIPVRCAPIAHALQD